MLRSTENTKFGNLHFQKLTWLLPHHARMRIPPANYFFWAKKCTWVEIMFEVLNGLVTLNKHLVKTKVEAAHPLDTWPSVRGSLPLPTKWRFSWNFQGIWGLMAWSLMSLGSVPQGTSWDRWLPPFALDGSHAPRKCQCFFTTSWKTCGCRETATTMWESQVSSTF